MNNEKTGKLLSSIVAVVTEEYRFRRTFDIVLKKVDSEYHNRLCCQYRWFSKKIAQLSEEVDMHLVIYKNTPYDVGIAATPINIDEFDKHDELIIEDTLEPTVMLNGTVFKAGVVVLRRKE